MFITWQKMFIKYKLSKFVEDCWSLLFVPDHVRKDVDYEKRKLKKKKTLSPQHPGFPGGHPSKY